MKKNYFVQIGGTGWGEASGSVYYGPSPEEIADDLGKGAEKVGRFKKATRAELEELEQLEICHPARYALSAAFLNCLSSLDNQYPWAILNVPAPKEVRTSFTVSIASPDEMIEEMRQVPYPIIKVKMGFEGDEELVQRMKRISGKNFRVDANGGWSLEKAENMIHELAKLGVEVIEQPTKPEFAGEWKHLKGAKRVSMIIDEGLNTIDDYEKFADFVDGINIKMAKAGGVLAGISLVKVARRDKLKVMLGCMVETSIAIAPAVYISGLADYFDLDGPLLMENENIEGVNFDVDKINLSEDIIGGPRMIDRTEDAEG